MREKKSDAPRKLGLYLHIPFCVNKCPYCDFYSIADLSLIDRYLAALTKQMEAYATQTQAYVVDTVYVGGGTPTLLSRQQMRRLFKAAGKHFKLASDAEITVEANPESADRKLFSALRKLGVNRLSIGVQSFEDTLLQKIGRLHTAAQAEKAVEAAKAAKITNLSIDLMFGLPEESPQQFYDSLQKVFDLGVTHLSAYGLKIEEDTPFWEVRDDLNLPDERAWVEQYLELTRKTQTAGYRQYEISNFCLPGFESRHNLKYWTMAEYLGLGPGAHSYLGNRRFAFIKDVRGYCEAIESGEGQIVSELFEIAPHDALADTIMLSLRRTEGIDLQAFFKTFRRDFVELTNGKLDKYINADLMTIENGFCRLTPRGFCVSNHILADLIDF